MVTIKDVAKKAGVSIATVSRVINDTGTVSPEYVKAVQKAVEELDYQPNSVAQAMKKRTFCTIGVIMSDFSVPFFEKIIKNIEREYRGNGNLVLFVNTYDDPEIELQGIRFLVEKQADVLLISSTGENEDYLSRLQERGMSIILIDRRARKHSFPAIYVDKRVGMYQVMEYLTEMHHERVALISGPRQLTTNYDRYEGASRFYYEHALNQNNMQYFFGSFSEQYGCTVMEQLLHSGNSPTAVVVGSAVIAAGVISCCRENKVCMPDDISLISFGDLASGKLIEPRLTYVDDGHKEIGQRLVGMVDAALNHRLPHEEIVLQPKLVINDSVKELDRADSGSKTGEGEAENEDT